MNVNTQERRAAKRMSLTAQRAVTATGKGEAKRRAKGGHEGEAER